MIFGLQQPLLSAQVRSLSKEQLVLWSHLLVVQVLSHRSPIDLEPSEAFLPAIRGKAQSQLDRIRLTTTDR